MKILAVDTSSLAASAAIVDGDKLIGEFFCNTNLKHSQTIMLMIDSLFKSTKLAIDSIDLFAVTIGPGSFTGLRIGLSAVKALGYATGRSVVGVSTLHALAMNSEAEGIICPVMDARCNQVYTALFDNNNQKLVRLTEDLALLTEELEDRLKTYDKPITLVGDAAVFIYEKLFLKIPQLRLGSPAYLHQRAACAAYLARDLPSQSPASLCPVYLRLPQAERERLSALLDLPPKPTI